MIEVFTLIGCAVLGWVLGTLARISIVAIGRSFVLRFLVALLVVGCFFDSAKACERCGLFGNRCALKQVQAVVAQPIYAQPYAVNYFVGAPIRVEAIVQQALRADPQWQEFQQFKQWQTLRAHEPQATSQAVASSLIAANCASCHSGAKPAKGLVLDGETAVTCEQKLAAMKAVRDGKMPPPNKAAALSPEAKGDLLSELLDLPTIGGDP